MRTRFTLLLSAAAAIAIQPNVGGSEARSDWHVHLSLESVGALDSLFAHGIIAVRDCGGEMDSLLRGATTSRREGARGRRLYVAGPLIDGPKPDAAYRLDAYARELCRAAGVRTTTLRVSPENKRAIAFYRKHGWHDRGPDPGHPDVHIMERANNSSSD